MSQPHPDASAKMDAYIASLPETWREVCEELRALVHKAAPTLVEDWKWGCPCFTGNSLVCGFAAFKKHVTFDFWNGARIDDRHGIFNHGEGNARGRGVKLVAGDKIPKKALAEYVRQAAKLDAESAKGPRKTATKARRKALPVPEVLADALALKKNKKARDFFESLPPSARRDYSEWIGSAKRQETVQRRLVKALEQLARGERMHEKYR